MQYHGKIFIGKPLQEFKVIFDSSSADLWILSYYAKTMQYAVKRHAKYNYSKSSTYVPNGNSWSIQFVGNDFSSLQSEDIVTKKSLYLEEILVIMDDILSNEQLLTSKLDQAELCYDNGSYNDAITSYDLANKQIQEKSMHDYLDDKDYIRLTCRSWIGLMKSKFQLHQLDEAKKDFSEKISHFRNKCPSSLLAEAYYIMGNVYVKNGEYYEASDHFEAAIKYLNSSEDDLLTLAQYGKASIYMLRNEIENARSVFLKSLAKQLQIIQNSIEKTAKSVTPLDLSDNELLLSESHVNHILQKLNSSLSAKMKKTVKFALLYDTIGKAFYMQGDYLGAIAYFMKSYNIKKNRFKENSWYRADSVEYLGNAYFASDQLDNAKKYFKILQKIKKDTGFVDYQLQAKINNILGEICFRTRKVTHRNDKEGPLKESIKYFEEAVKFAKDKKGDKIELSKAYYGIGKAKLGSSQFEAAKKHLEASMEILKGISSHRCLLIADIRDQIAKLYRLRQEIDTSNKEYKESLQFRKDFCDQYDIDFVRSYYSETRWEKYISRNDSILTDLNKKRLCNEMDEVYAKLNKMYNLFSNHTKSFENHQTAAHDQKCLQGQDLENFKWLKDEIDKIDAARERLLENDNANITNINTDISSNNSYDQPGSSHCREKFNLANNSRNKKLSSEVGKRDFLVKKLETMLDRADKFCENGSYIKAIDKYTQVHQFDNRKEKFIDKNYLMKVKFRTTFGMMACHYRLYELDEANKYFSTAVSYAEDTCERYSIAKCYSVKANICIREEKYDEALNYCDKAITYLDQKERLTLYTMIEHDTAKVLILQHKYEQAWNIYIQALQSQLKSVSLLMKKDSKRSECLDLVHSDQLISEKNLSNLLNKVENCLLEKEKKGQFLALLYDTAGNIFYLQSNYQAAIIQYLKSYRIKEKILKSQDYLLLISKEYLSKAYFASDQLDNAEKYYKFLATEENCKGRNDYCKRFKAKLNNVLGEICFKKGEYDTSISYYENSKTFHSSSDRSEHEGELSKTLYGIGR
ncbi:Cathepsin D, partial [Trichoplax sp. H2]